jgi:hypothetical protein
MIVFRLVGDDFKTLCVFLHNVKCLLMHLKILFTQFKYYLLSYIHNLPIVVSLIKGCPYCAKVYFNLDINKWNVFKTPCLRFTVLQFKFKVIAWDNALFIRV